MLELFRQEVETHIATLKQCLSVLKTQPNAMNEVEQAIQAAHLLWGNTSIVELDAASNLVQLIKDCFIAVQKQTIGLKEEQIDTLLHASDLLLSMSQATGGDLEAWIKEHTWDWNTTQKAIANIGNPEAATDDNPPAVDNSPQATENPPPAVNNSPPVAENPPPAVNNSPPVAENPPPAVENSPPVTENPPSIPSPPPSPPAEIAAIANIDPEMMDLFRLEAEAQVVVLNNGLLVIESNPKSMQDLEALMRSAHSIKGAARIVGLDGVVQLAHVMEDCFVAAQNKVITLTPDDVDILLQGVDLLQHVSQTSDTELVAWLTENQGNFADIRDDVAAILEPEKKRQKAPARQPDAIAHQPEAVEIKPVETQPVEAKPDTATIEQPAIDTSPPSIPAPVPTPVPQLSNPSPSSQIVVQEQSQPVAISKTSKRSSSSSNSSSSSSGTENIANADRVVRVSADNLNRIMGLAGESLIEANWLQPFADSIMSLKSRMLEMSRSLEQLEESLEQNLYEQEGKEYLAQAQLQKQDCIDDIAEKLNDLELYVRRTASLSDRLYREVINSHMRPFEDGLQSFPRMIRDLARSLNKRAKLEILGKSTPVDRDILKKLEAPLTHILRNAVDHGLELPEERIAAGKPPEGTIRLEAFHRGGMLAITISDDGKGIDREQLCQKIIKKNFANAETIAQHSDAELMEFLFLPGFSTAKQVTEISGRGVGLDIAKSMAQDVGGTVRAISHAGKGTSFHFQLPLTLSVVRTLLVEISGKPYAIPLARIDQLVNLDLSEITDVENRQYFTMNDRNIGLISAHQILELPASEEEQNSVSVVTIGDQSSTYGLVVDKFLGERDLVVKPLDSRLGKVPDISATALLGDGSPILIIDVSDMVQSMDTILKGGKLSKVMIQSESESSQQRKRILVVDDSITVREMERKILENRGYYVDTAVNGVDGWNAVRTNPYDLVISDIDMPRMNGIELVKKIKNNPRFNSLPVIIISYRDRKEDRVKGLEAGADYYLTKSSFQDDTLIEAVIDLVGK